MDADMMAVYKRLAKQYVTERVVFTHDRFPEFFLRDLCTAELTTFLKETN